MKSIFTIACALALTGASARAEETFHIVQQKPELVHIDLGKDGASHGDILAFEAGFTAEDGKTGIMSGIITTVGIPAKDGEFFDRVGNIVLDFGGIDTLVIAGKSVYAVGAGEMVVDAPQIVRDIGSPDTVRLLSRRVRSCDRNALRPGVWL